MWNFIKKHWFRSTAFLFLSAVFLSLIFSNGHYQVFHLIRFAGAAVALSIIVAYARTAITFLTSRKAFKPASGLITGIWLSQVGIFGHVVNNIVAQFTSKPSQIIHDHVSVISLATAIIGGFLVLVSSENLIEKPAYVIGLLVFFVTIVVFIISTFISPGEWWYS